MKRLITLNVCVMVSFFIYFFFITGLFREVETHMVWYVKIVVGQPDTVPAHLVDQVFPDNDDLLAAVLDPAGENMPSE